MSLSHNALQKKRAKKKSKRTKNTGSRLGALLGFSREWALASRGPVADTLVPGNLFEAGIGHVWFSRRLPDGRYAMAGFLVDTFCLGVKNALYKVLEPDQYASMLERIFSSTEERLDRQHPACIRKLVEGAVAYARDLGFDPHPDYKIAKAIFGDVDASACPVGFIFGQDDKPFYVSGPHDSLSMQRRIVTQLERRCGSDGFHFLISTDQHGVD